MAQLLALQEGFWSVPLIAGWIGEGEVGEQLPKYRRDKVRSMCYGPFPTIYLVGFCEFI